MNEFPTSFASEASNAATNFSRRNVGGISLISPRYNLPAWDLWRRNRRRHTKPTLLPSTGKTSACRHSSETVSGVLDAEPDSIFEVITKRIATTYGFVPWAILKLFAAVAMTTTTTPLSRNGKPSGKRNN